MRVNHSFFISSNLILQCHSREKGTAYLKFKWTITYRFDIDLTKKTRKVKNVTLAEIIDGDYMIILFLMIGFQSISHYIEVTLIFLPNVEKFSFLTNVNAFYLWHIFFSTRSVTFAERFMLGSCVSNSLLKIIGISTCERCRN